METEEAVRLKHVFPEFTVGIVLRELLQSVAYGHSHLGRNNLAHQGKAGLAFVDETAVHQGAANPVITDFRTLIRNVKIIDRHTLKQRQHGLPVRPLQSQRIVGFRIGFE